MLNVRGDIIWVQLIDYADNCSELKLDFTLLRLEAELLTTTGQYNRAHTVFVRAFAAIGAETNPSYETLGIESQPDGWLSFSGRQMSAESVSGPNRDEIAFLYRSWAVFLLRVGRASEALKYADAVCAYSDTPLNNLVSRCCTITRLSDIVLPRFSYSIINVLGLYRFLVSYIVLCDMTQRRCCFCKRWTGIISLSCPYDTRFRGPQ